MIIIDQILNYILVIRPVKLGPHYTWGIVNETATASNRDPAARYIAVAARVWEGCIVFSDWTLNSII